MEIAIGIIVIIIGIAGVTIMIYYLFQQYKDDKGLGTFDSRNTRNDEMKMENFKACPFCEERIPAGSTKCPYCAENLVETRAAIAKREVQEEKPDVVHVSEIRKGSAKITPELPQTQAEQSESELKRKLDKLWILFTDGIITEEEFKAKREKLINEYLDKQETA